MKSVIFKIKNTKSSTYVRNFPTKAYTLRCTSQKICIKGKAYS